MAKKTYRVKKGDNYFKIAEKLWGNQLFAGQLIRANPGINKLFPGIVLKLPKVDINDPHPFFGQAAWERAGRTSGSSGRLPGQTPPQQAGIDSDRRREELLDAKLGADLPEYEYDAYPRRSGSGHEEDPAYGRRGVRQASKMRREDIPDWVYEDFSLEELGGFSHEEVWDEVNEFVRLAEELGLAPRGDEEPEGAGVMGAPDVDEVGQALPEAEGNLASDGSIVEKRPVKQEGDEDEQKREELLNIWESARQSDKKMMAQYGSSEMDLEEVDWEVNWLITLDMDDLEGVVYGRRAVVEEEELVDFLKDQEISRSSILSSSDYAISDLPLNKLDSEGSQPGIQYLDVIDQMEVLQNYWGLDDMEMLSVVREIYYPEALDEFLANAKDTKIPELSDKDVELGDSRIITKEEVAYALTVLMFGQPLRGDLDENNPALGYRGALVPVMYGEGESGIDHMIAGLEGFKNPANDGEFQMKEGGRRFVIESLGSEKLIAGEAVSWEGDLGSVVAERLKNEGFSMTDAYRVGMPRQDFEGDILAAVIHTEGLLESEGLSGALRAVYDPEGLYYPQRYEIFAMSILAPKNEDGSIVEGIRIDSLINPMTGKINPDVREVFIETHWNNVGNYAIGIIKSDGESDPEDLVDYWKGFDLRPSEQVTSLAKQVLNYFLDELERAIWEEKDTE